MKGKGKGEREKAEKPLDVPKECPLSFPELTPVDHTRMCPRYTAGRPNANTFNTNPYSSTSCFIRAIRLVSDLYRF